MGAGEFDWPSYGLTEKVGECAARGVAVVFVKITKGYSPINEFELCGSFERGDLPRFQTEFEVPITTTACTLLSHGGCFYPEKTRRASCGVDKKMRSDLMGPEGPEG